MKEALKVITSAWSVAFIVLFFVVVTAAEPSDPERKTTDAYLTVIFLILAVTGAGWLWHRHCEKSKEDDSNG